MHRISSTLLLPMHARQGKVTEEGSRVVKAQQLHANGGWSRRR